jgi:hypothetical protein
MKICGKCKLEKDNSDFNKNKDRLSSYCKKCVREASKKHYNSNKEDLLDRRKDYYIERRKWYAELKETLKCEKCDENHPATLDFHHIDSQTKDFGVAAGLTRLNLSKEKILKEISKCRVLCSNCHRKLHYDENNNLGL